LPKGRIFSILVGLFFLALLVMNYHVNALLSGKWQRKIWLLQYPDPTVEGSQFPYPLPMEDSRVLVNADL
jgi:hypothetical protein